MISNLQLLKESEENIIWFQENLDYIREEFFNKIIAIKNKSIIASADNINELMRKLEENNIDPSEVLIESIYQKDEITIF